MKTRQTRYSRSFRAAASAIMILAALASYTTAVRADDSSGALKAGMTAFNAGNYSEAAGHFGLALTTEFNNSVLHYYLGNCYVHMKQREAAIREFRIAYALDPEKDVGKFAKQALAGLNADSPGSAPSSGAPASPAMNGKDADAMAKNAVNKLMDWKSKSRAAAPSKGSTSAGSPASAGMPPIVNSTPPFDPSKSSLPPGKPFIEISRGGRLIEQMPIPVPAPKPGQPQMQQMPPMQQPLPPFTGNYRLDGLRKLYESNHASAQSNFELQRAAENLHELMTQQAKPGEHHVVPAGTNLYIRNYKTEGGGSSNGTGKPPHSN